MKRCPTCNRTFEEDWLAFCTQDGTTLIDDSPSRSSEPPPTILSPPPPPPGGWKPPSGDLGSGQFQSQPFQPTPPSNMPAPSGGFGSAPFQPPQQMQGGWQPPPPPLYAKQTQQGLALASMICGIFTITIGWCYVGIISGPVAVVLGIIALVQIKKDPDKYSGKPFAVTGIATGAVYLAIVVLLIFFGVLGTLLQK